MDSLAVALQQLFQAQTSTRKHHSLIACAELLQVLLPERSGDKPQLPSHSSLKGTAKKYTLDACLDGSVSQVSLSRATWLSPTAISVTITARVDSVGDRVLPAGIC